MRRRTLLASMVFVGAVAAAFAQSADAPLSDTKRQLQSLQTDKSAQKAGADDGQSALRGAIPVPETAATVQLPPLPSAKTERERDAKQKADARRNWLLDGYDKLGRRKDGALTLRADASDPMSEDEPLDPADPDYFLRVYEKQRAETLARRSEAAAASDTPAAAGVGADAFAPFLQNWLAGSPVRDALRDVAGSRTAGGASTSDGVYARDGFAPQGAAVGNASAAGNSSASAMRLESGASRDTSTANPFIQALGLPTAPEARSSDLRSPTADSAPPPAVVLPKLQLPTDAEPKSSQPRATVPPPRDEKKYFPQLKKF